MSVRTEPRPKLWLLSLFLWLALSGCVLGIATFRQAPYIALIAFFAARDLLGMTVEAMRDETRDAA